MRNVAPGSTAISAIAAMLFVTGGAQAMEIQLFDRMAGADQDEYVAELVQGAERVLNEAGKTEDAQAVHRMFTTNADNGVSVGMNTFMIYLALVRDTDASRVAEDPNAERLHVEHVMYIALKKDGIVLPPKFMHVADSFKPTHPPK